MLGGRRATNRDNELYIIEEGFRNGWIAPRVPARRTDRRVAVVGSGPAGLAAADLLNRLGHRVTVVERADRPGGLLMYGIPNMKLPKEIVARRVGLMKAEGVGFCLHTAADASLRAEFDAVLLCGGARARPAAGGSRRKRKWRGAGRGLPHRSHPRPAGRPRALAHRAGQGRARGRRRRHRQRLRGHLPAAGLQIRCGSWKCCPLRRSGRAKANPWPEWPRVLRTDYGQLEAIAAQGGDPRLFETTVERVLADENGNVRAVETVRVARGTDGRTHAVEGTRRTLPCQLLLIAARLCRLRNRKSPSASPFPQRPPPSRHTRRHTCSRPRPLRRWRHARRSIAGRPRPRRRPRRRHGGAPLSRRRGAVKQTEPSARAQFRARGRLAPRLARRFGVSRSLLFHLSFNAYMAQGTGRSHAMNRPAKQSPLPQILAGIAHQGRKGGN